MTKFELWEYLRNINGQIQLLEKKIMSMDITGLGLVREDLGIRRPKKEKKETVYGQVHREPAMHNRITAPGEVKSDTPNLGPDYPTWAR